MSQKKLRKKKTPFIVYLLWLGFIIAGLYAFFVLTKPLEKQASKTPEKPAKTKPTHQHKYNPKTNLYSVSDKNFVVLSSNQNIANFILPKAEEYLSAENIGIKNKSIPGQVTIRVFNTFDEYRKNTNMPSWSDGYADVYNNKIYIIYDPGNSSTLAHEISHIVFGNYIYQSTPYTFMLNEGLASVEQMRYDLNLKVNMQYCLNEIENGNYTPLNKLGSASLDQEDQSTVEVWYAESASVVYFLESRYGMDKFTSFMTNLKNNVSFENAISAVYGINSVGELQNLWFKDIKNTNNYFNSSFYFTINK